LAVGRFGKSAAGEFHWRSRGMVETIEVDLGHENENANGSERQGRKVMELGLAWFGLLTSGT
jgi:hypothetical protein